MGSGLTGITGHIKVPSHIWLTVMSSLRRNDKKHISYVHNMYILQDICHTGYTVLSINSSENINFTEILVGISFYVPLTLDACCIKCEKHTGIGRLQVK